MAKMDKKWVALCSAAIAAVYAAGYVTTETEAAPAQTPQQYAQTDVQSGGGWASQADPFGQNGQASKSAGQPGKTSQSKKLYKDGTYTGMGSNRRGSIQVAVTIKNDKITDVEISHFAMHYSESDVVGLPGEVLQKQSAHVNNVSGATYSTQAFEDAVQDALTQAKNA
ncbi:FMN-binding protein [Gordoniibacillus kamchatkensis]|uniref:FMN-binding protein n=1 Tax=Gordoniibacillus kamchatkensis TaxID=1590651 RepID=A0ABR5AD43_9BACL|nr:FMN-binding protein [Paenibacillus sp. VKM B-2647]KIL38956.1 FMN-binding protein [Paenibacillus sp. VKM B-2647]